MNGRCPFTRQRVRPLSPTHFVLGFVEDTHAYLFDTALFLQYRQRSRAFRG